MGYCADTYLVSTRGSQRGATSDELAAYNACIASGKDKETEYGSRRDRGGTRGPANDPYWGGYTSPNEDLFGAEGRPIKLGDPLYSAEEIQGAIPGLDVTGFPGFGDMDPSRQSLVASFAGMAELQQGEAEYAKQQASDPLNYLKYFQVSPYRGNFYNEQGGFIGDTSFASQDDTLPISLELIDKAFETYKGTKSKKGKVSVSKALGRILDKVQGSRDSGNFVNQMGGMQGSEEEEYIPIQTEKGERLIFNNGLTSPVKADKKHSKVDDDLVTDIVPQGTYVASASPKMKLRKDDAKNYELGIDDKPYKIGMKTEQPKRLSLADYYTKKNKLTPADLVDKVDKKHPVKDLEEYHNDPFIGQTNDHNLMYRQNVVLPAIIQASEDKAQDFQTKEMFLDMATISGVQKFEYGGEVKKQGVTKHNPALLAALIPAAAQLFGSIFSGVTASNQDKKNQREITKQSKEIEKLLSAAKADSMNSLGKQLSASLMGTLSQDPGVRSFAQTPEYQQQYSLLEGMRGFAESQEVAAKDYAVNTVARNLQPMVEQASRTYGESGRNAAMAQYAQAIADAGSKVASDSAGRRVNVEQGIRTSLANLNNTAAQANTQAVNQTTQNQNYLLSQVGQQVAGNERDRMNISNQFVTADINRRQWEVGSRISSRNAKAQGVSDAFAIGANAVGQGAQAYYQYNQGQNQGVTNNAPGYFQNPNPYNPYFQSPSNYQFNPSQYQYQYGPPQSNLPAWYQNQGGNPGPGLFRQEMGGYAARKGVSVSDTYIRLSGKK